MSNDSNSAQTSREDVATFAMWCVGSCHGDWDPRTDAEGERVMKDDTAFDWWKDEFGRYRSAKETREPYAGSDGPFINNERVSGVHPAEGKRAKTLTDISMRAFELIRIIEREKSGIRDGDGYWRGCDPLDGTICDIWTKWTELQVSKGPAPHECDSDLPF